MIRNLDKTFTNNLAKITSKLSWSLFGNIIYALSQWYIITLLARSGNLEDLGLYSLGLAITAPVILLFELQLRTVLATDINNDYSFSQYFGARIIHISLAYLIIIIIAVIYSNDYKTLLVILMIGVIKYFESMSDICMGYFQKDERLDLIGKSQFYRGIFSIIMVSIMYLTTHNLLFSLLALMITMIFRLAFYDLKHLKKIVNITPIIDYYSYELLIIAFPLGITGFILSINTNIPRYILDYYWGVELVGVFSALFYILVASNMIITPITQLAAPRVATAFHQSGNRPFIKINIKLIVIAIIVSLLVIIPIQFKSELILRVLYGESYVVYSDVFTIISYSLIFSFIIGFLSLSIVSARLFHLQSIASILTTVITLFIGIYLIKNHGLYGSAVSLLVSRIVHTFLYVLILIYINIVKK